MNYENTIGCEIGRKRGELKWSEDILATQVNRVLDDTAKKSYDRDDIIDWESNTKIPDKNEIEILVKLLITSNSKITDKTGAEAKFRKAHQDTLAAFESGKFIPGDSSIGREIRRLRGDESELALAGRISENLPPTRVVTWQEIQDLEHHNYDRELFDTIVDVYVFQKILNATEATKLKERYVQLDPKSARKPNLYELHRQLLDYCQDVGHIAVAPYRDIHAFLDSSSNIVLDEINTAMAQRNQDKIPEYRELFINVREKIRLLEEPLRNLEIQASLLQKAIGDTNWTVLRRRLDVPHEQFENVMYGTATFENVPSEFQTALKTQFNYLFGRILRSRAPDKKTEDNSEPEVEAVATGKEKVQDGNSYIDNWFKAKKIILDEVQPPPRGLAR